MHPTLRRIVCQISYKRPPSFDERGYINATDGSVKNKKGTEGVVLIDSNGEKMISHVLVDI